MTAFDVVPAGRVRHLVYLAALVASALCVGWVVAALALDTMRDGSEPLRALGAAMMLLLIPFAPACCLLIAACWLAVSGRPAPAAFQMLALAVAAWSVLFISALVAM